ncbi:MAG: hypothetical protein K940chlam9_00316 [Chlamydiae bacterium]|nr:hypothetical protein [Chlamydiota bacterium]
MTLNDLSLLFTRAWQKVWNLNKLLIIFGVLVLSGLVCLFFQIAAHFTSPPFRYSLQVLPLFLAIGFLLAGGVYVLGEKEKKKSLLQTTYLSIPLLVTFLLLWVLLGFLVLLKSVPYVGKVLGVLLAFLPFLLNLATLLLFVGGLLALFFLTPKIAMGKKWEVQSLWEPIARSPFIASLSLLIGIVPVWIAWEVLMGALKLTFQTYSFSESPLERLLQAFFTILPFSALLAPFVLFFFNFGQEVEEAVDHAAPHREDSSPSDQESS